MKFDAPKNSSYAATIVEVHTIVDLSGLDNLVGVPVLGHQALTTKGIEAGDLRVVFTAETELSEDFCAINNLYRDATLNKDPAETGYLDKNRRIRALKLRGHVSNALLMPVGSLAYTGVDFSALRPGDTFDSLNGHAICRKYEIPVKVHNHVSKSRIEKAFRRVDTKLFPEHLDTDNYWRNKHLLKPRQEVVVTAKLHGTSWRGGRVPVLRQLKWHERFLKRLGVQIPEYEFDVVFGSRKVIKDPGKDQNHFYTDDIWTGYGKSIAELIPEGFIIYGELIGWTPDKAPLQKGYTYHCPEGSAELFVYRVAHINAQGHLSDLSWDGVKDFCRSRGLKWVPELERIPAWDAEAYVSGYMDKRLADYPMGDFIDNQLPLSDRKTVDEGVCLRQEGLVPLILKAKSPEFLAHETRILDAGEADLESVS